MQLYKIRTCAQKFVKLTCGVELTREFLLNLVRKEVKMGHLVQLGAFYTQNAIY